jgi:hypothetical protein
MDGNVALQRGRQQTLFCFAFAHRVAELDEIEQLADPGSNEPTRSTPEGDERVGSVTTFSDQYLILATERSSSGVEVPKPKNSR